jgi:hypothetical protein
MRNNKPTCLCGEEFLVPLHDQLDALQFAFGWDEKEYAAIESLIAQAKAEAREECKMNKDNGIIEGWEGKFEWFFFYNWGDLYLEETPETKHAQCDKIRDFVRELIAQSKAEGREEAAHQCYLEVLAVSGEENEITEAIKTKFNL